MLHICGSNLKLSFGQWGMILLTQWQFMKLYLNIAETARNMTNNPLASTYWIPTICKHSGSCQAAHHLAHVCATYVWLQPGTALVNSRIFPNKMVLHDTAQKRSIAHRRPINPTKQSKCIATFAECSERMGQVLYPRHLILELPIRPHYLSPESILFLY